MFVRLRRMVLFSLLLSVLSACDSVSNQIQVQLNTHLGPVTEIVHSTSPDGNYRIVSVAPTLDYRFLYLEDTNTGLRTLLDDAVHEVIGVLWAPNSQFVNYDWEDTRRWRYHGIAVTQTGEILLAGEGFAGTKFEAFSFDGEYLAMSHHSPVVNYQVTVYPTRHYRYHEAIATLEGVNRLAWSPIDHRLAYATFSGLGMLDLDTGVTHQEPHFTGDSFVQSRYLGSLVWSPDGHYLTMNYLSASIDYEVGIYSTENRSLTLLTTFAAAVPYNTAYLFQEPFTSDSRYIIYFTKLNSEDPYFDMWRFNTNTLQHELLADNLTNQQLSCGRFVIVRKTSDEWWLEIRDRAGFLLRSYSLNNR